MRHHGLIVLGLLLTLAACGQPEAGGTPTPSAGAAAERDDTALKFSQCMREQGLTWFPDPQPNGNLQVKVPPGTPKEKMDAAAAACREFAPGNGERGEPDPERLEQARKVSQCMRDNGVPNFPDPSADGGMHLDRDQLGTGPGDPAFDQADEKCRKLMPQRPSEKREEGGR